MNHLEHARTGGPFLYEGDLHGYLTGYCHFDGATFFFLDQFGRTHMVELSQLHPLVPLKNAIPVPFIEPSDQAPLTPEQADVTQDFFTVHPGNWQGAIVNVCGISLTLKDHLIVQVDGDYPEYLEVHNSAIFPILTGL